MKARVKATGETIDVEKYVDGIYMSTDSARDVYVTEDLDFWLNEPSSFDYWTRLEHQYAGQFMQAMISSSNYIGVSEEDMANAALRIAHALVEKMKEEEKW